MLSLIISAFNTPLRHPPFLRRVPYEEAREEAEGEGEGEGEVGEFGEAGEFAEAPEEDDMLDVFGDVGTTLLMVIVGRVFRSVVSVCSSLTRMRPDARVYVLVDV